MQSIGFYQILEEINYWIQTVCTFSCNNFLIFCYSLLEENTEIVVAGDGQMDSPGHFWNHWVYSLMDTSNFYILHVQNVDVRSTQLKTTVMERKGCEELLYLLQNLKVMEFVSDANSQIIKMLSTLLWYFLINHI